MTSYLNEHNEEKIQRAANSTRVHENEELSRLFDAAPELSTKFLSKAQTFETAQRAKSLADKLSTKSYFSRRLLREADLE